MCPRQVVCSGKDQKQERSGHGGAEQLIFKAESTCEDFFLGKQREFEAVKPAVVRRGHVALTPVTFPPRTDYFLEGSDVKFTDFLPFIRNVLTLTDSDGKYFPGDSS